ncbi:MAG TPA: hypothetical protein VIZ90_01485 [Rhizobiaceae bacterium]
MTPLEASASPRVWRKLFGTRRIPPGSEIRRFKRTGIHPDVKLYSADAGARTLIIGFCGRRLRLMMPIALTLQHLDDRQYDVLTLGDRRHLHFDAGIEGFAGSLPELARRISEIIDPRGYSSVISYGISAGGFPALRLASLLNVDRAISVGGRPAWHIDRLLEQKSTINAFDLICHCRATPTARLYSLFSAPVEEDAEAAAKLAAVMPGIRLAGIPCPKHNFPYEMFKKGVLSEYHDELFGQAREPDLARLATLMA